MKHFLLAIVIGLCGCGTSNEADSNNKEAGGETAADTSLSDGGTMIESEVLKGELRKLMIESFQAKSPERAASEIESQVDARFDAEVKKMQQIDPNFLMVSASYEEDLKSGHATPDIAAQVEAVQKKFDEFGLELPEVARTLIAAYQAGNLSPVRQELLSQLIDMSYQKLNQDIQ